MFFVHAAVASFILSETPPNVLLFFFFQNLLQNVIFYVHLETRSWAFAAVMLSTSWLIVRRNVTIPRSLTASFLVIVYRLYASYLLLLYDVTGVLKGTFHHVHAAMLKNTSCGSGSMNQVRGFPLRAGLVDESCLVHLLMVSASHVLTLVSAMNRPQLITSDQ